MIEPALLSAALQSFATGAAKREGAHFRFAILFGSYARGEADEDSDVDVAVVLDRWSGGMLDEVLALSEIAYDVLLETGVLIQPVPVRLEEWEHPDRYPNPRFLENVRREGVPL